MATEDRTLELAAAREKIRTLEAEVSSLRRRLDSAELNREQPRLQAALQALEEGEARFGAIFDNSPAAIYLKSLDGRLLMVNRAVQKLFGRSPDQIVGKTDDAFMPAVMAEEVRANDRRVLEEQRPIEFREEIESAGGRRTFLTIKFPLFDQDGQIVALGGISTDITEMDRARRERERLLAELTTTLDSLETAVIVYNSGGEIVRVNRAAEQGLGYEPAALEDGFSQRFSLWRMSSLEARPQPVKSSFFVRVMKGETIRSELCLLQRDDGRKSWVSINASPIHTPDGSLHGAVVTLTDVSNVQALQEGREDLVRVLSGDLITPITAILGFATLLKESAAQGSECTLAGGYLDTILVHARQLRDRVTRLGEALRADDAKKPGQSRSA